ncbi:uncharacterized protein LOC134428226 isoform X1 [Melospiza melodia melodia]|uniref:uncharacterized protein LOC134428226 isoform X1 n=1 Tax=Melospiza melodia melodia TaxID=1914991 RepID=UPI002FD3B3FC
MPPVPNGADPEVPRMDPRVLIFLLYVMILHELVSGWMEYQKQMAKPKKQAGPVWSSSSNHVSLLCPRAAAAAAAPGQPRAVSPGPWCTQRAGSAAATGGSRAGSSAKPERDPGAVGRLQSLRQPPQGLQHLHRDSIHPSCRDLLRARNPFLRDSSLPAEEPPGAGDGLSWDSGSVTHHHQGTLLSSPPRAEWMESRFPRGKVGFAPAWAAPGRLPVVSGSSSPSPGLPQHFPKRLENLQCPVCHQSQEDLPPLGHPEVTLGMLAPLGHPGVTALWECPLLASCTKSLPVILCFSSPSLNELLQGRGGKMS